MHKIYVIGKLLILLVLKF